MPPTPFQRIEELTRHNSSLQAELAKLQRIESANAYFRKEVKKAEEIIQQAIFEWRRAKREVDNDFKESSQYDRESVDLGLA